MLHNGGDWRSGWMLMVVAEQVAPSKNTPRPNGQRYSASKTNGTRLVSTSHKGDLEVLNVTKWAAPFKAAS